MNNPQPAQPGPGDRQSLRPTFALMAFVVLSALAVVPVLFLGTLESNHRVEELLEAFDSRAEQQVASVSNMLVQVLQGKAEVLAVTAGTLSALPNWSHDQLQEIGDAQLIATRSFDAFYVADADGRSIIFAPSVRKDGTPTRTGVDYSDREYYQEMLRTKQTTYSHVQVGKQSGIANLVVAVPILDETSPRSNPELRGYVAAGIHIPIISSLVRQILHVEEGLRVIVVDAEQKVLVDSAGRLKMLERVPGESSWGGHCPTTRTGYEATDESGVLLRMACSPMHLGEQTWTIYAGRSTDHILQGVASARESTRHFALLTLFISIAISAMLAIAIAQQMRRFHSIAGRIAAGERGVDVAQIPWFSPRELLILSRVINGTLRQLERADDEVQGLVTDLRQTNQRIEPLATAWEQISDAVEVLDENGVVQFVNPAWVELTGRMDWEPVGRLSSLFESDFLTDEHADGSALLQRVRRGQSWTGEVRTRTQQGIRVQNVVATPVFDETHQLRVVIVIRRDLTQLRQAEQTAAQNDRLAAIGTLAAGLAHEINNPLTYIQMNLQLIAEGVTSQEPLDEDEVLVLANDAVDGVDRVTRIVQDLLALARKAPDAAATPMAPLDVAEVVRAAVTLAGPQTNTVSLVELSVPPGLQCVGRESELVQVMLNLIINASQAMHGRPRDTNRINITACSDESFVWLEVQDNGPGIPDELQTRIFEPLFTTKPVGEGTGLGLSVSRTIIEAHGGRIEIASEVNQGCRFTLCIPKHVPTSLTKTDALPAAPKVVGPQLQPQPQPASNPRVLLVDDDPLVARSLGRVLAPLGVVVVDSGLAGLDALETHDFEVVVSDVRMPEMSGPEFCALAQELRAIPFVFVTGGTTEADQKLLDQLPWPVLKKPIRGPHLIETVSNYLLDPSTEPSVRDPSMMDNPESATA